MTRIPENRLTRDDDPETFVKREQDWRNGAIVYQVLVDRFAPSTQLDAKHALYPSPKALRDWSETPKPGRYLSEAKLNSQELDFWGGDFASLRDRLDHVQELGANVLYLNPIHLAYTNHKYDALDFLKISPEFGDRDDFLRLVEDVHARGIKLVLDGVLQSHGPERTDLSGRAGESNQSMAGLVCDWVPIRGGCPVLDRLPKPA